MSVTQGTNSLIANLTGASYQWFDCDANIPINGETNQYFVASYNGSFAVIVDNGNCEDTSACYQITSVGFSASNYNNISLFPNPSNNITNISLGKITESVNIEINDISGKTMLIKDFYNIEKIKINTSILNKGIYFVKIITNNNINVLRLIVE